MGLEIERKFLIDKLLWEQFTKPEPLFCAQTYLSRTENGVVRVRVLGDKGFLTVKSKTVNISRKEFEYEIPKADALEMMNLTDESPIIKNRFKVDFKGNVWEVDVFEGENEGLILAEIELSSESQTFVKPQWVLTEVSGDERFYNSNLQKEPFSHWGN